MINLVYKHSRPIKYLFIGGVTGITFYSIIWICNNKLLLNEFITISIAYTICFFVHFCGNYFFTFTNSSNKLFYSALLKYLILYIINYFLAIFVNLILIKIFNMNIYLSTFIAILATIYTGYYLSRNWVFDYK
jgi:putative flippase GtrA